MTDLLSRPVTPTADPAPPRRSNASLPALYGLAAAVWTAAIGLITLVAVSVGGWFAADSGTFGDAIRVGGLAWLVGNGSGLELRSASLTLMPLGALLSLGWMVHRAGRWVGSRVVDPTWPELAVATAAISIGYAASAAVVATAANSTAAHVSLPRAVAATFLLGVLFGGLGTLRGAGRLGDLGALLPEEARAAGAGGVAGGLALVAASAALLTASLVLHFSTAVTLAEGMHAGLVGGAIATLISLALVPNGMLFAGAFLAGPGFAVGSGTVIAPGDVSTGPLPGFPLLAAVPRSASTPWLEVVLLLVPVAAGALAGLLAVRRFPVFAIDAAALRGALAGLVAGGGFGLLALLSGGSVGPGRMQEVGPGPSALLVCALACAVGGAIAGAGSRWIQASRASTASVS
jgi:hypothetical protein